MTATSGETSGEPAVFSADLSWLEAWMDDPGTEDTYDLRQWRHWREAPKVEEAMLHGGDDAAMGQLDWVIQGHLLQTLLTHCPDETVRAQVSLHGYPIPHPGLGCQSDDFAGLMDDLGVSHRDLAYRDLYVATLQQMRGDILAQMHAANVQMVAALMAQILRENPERQHLPYQWPLPEAKFACLQSDDPFATAARATTWETADLSTPYRPEFDADRWQVVREEALRVDETYVRRMVASDHYGMPIMPITNQETVEATMSFEEEEGQAIG